uniref:Uncharacterized protein n=1 Tax=Anopheles merus TaxID=30066 RepID=A0A182VAY2_ANOME
MVTCQKWMVLAVSLQLLALGTWAIPSPASSKRTEEAAPAAAVQLDSDTGDDRELKSDDDGYDFLSIDQLFLNNPQYRQLISDLQAHTFGSNWRRKRDVAENELPEAFRSDESLSSPRASTVPSTTTTTTTTTTAKYTTSAAVASSTPNEPLVTDVGSNRDMAAASSTASEMPKAAALTSTPAKSKESPKEVTKPSTASSTAGTSTTTGTTTTTAASSSVTATSVRGSSTVATSASYGSSGSTEAPVARNATLEMTTAAAPIRASTPRRLSHKNSSNKNKNKLTAAMAAAAQANKPTVSSGGPGPSTVNVNKVSVSSNAVASSSNQLPQQTPPAVTIPATENGTASGPAGNNKDKLHYSGILTANDRRKEAARQHAIRRRSNLRYAN